MLRRREHRRQSIDRHASWVSTLTGSFTQLEHSLWAAPCHRATLQLGGFLLHQKPSGLCGLKVRRLSRYGQGHSIVRFRQVHVNELLLGLTDLSLHRSPELTRREAVWTRRRVSRYVKDRVFN